MFSAYYIDKYDYYNIVKYFTIYAHSRVEFNRYAFFFRDNSKYLYVLGKNTKVE